MREYIRSLKMVPCIPYFGESSACGRGCSSGGARVELGWSSGAARVELLLGSFALIGSDVPRRLPAGLRGFGCSGWLK
ncbi:hypothetical protein EYF80_055330 [Liparis tanakae]|uniref:Uncharacterized protein n=1 Tax=Liparis tanakae TaxID=230148 RepID=A0A4Z2F158_9TELE|nr:hypothetical protein EYF80_055330 [Liparis tanakae]